MAPRAYARGVWGHPLPLSLILYNSGSQPVGREPKSGSQRNCREVANSNLNILLKPRIFGTSYINILCYIITTETRRDLCEVHIITTVIPI